MNHARLLRTLDNELRSLVEAEGGVLRISGTPEDVFTILSERPKEFALILQAGGSEPVDGGAPTTRGGIQRLIVHAIVSAGTGLDHRRHEAVHRDGPQGRTAFLDRLAWSVALLRRCIIGRAAGGALAGWVSMPDEVEPRPPSYLGWEWLEVEGIERRHALARFAWVCSEGPVQALGLHLAD